jgi:hypothetical protein
VVTFFFTDVEGPTQLSSVSSSQHHCTDAMYFDVEHCAGSAYLRQTKSQLTMGNDPIFACRNPSRDVVPGLG